MEFCKGGHVVLITVLSLKVILLKGVRRFVVCKQMMGVANVINNISSEVQFVWTRVT